MTEGGSGQVDLEAVKALLRDEVHVIDLREHGWTISHTLTCRSTGLFDCPINRAAESDLLEPPPEIPGRYVVELDPDGFLVIGERVTDYEQGIDVVALVDELEELREVLVGYRERVAWDAAVIRELRERYGKDDEVWCGARRDQAGSAYCVEMAGHEEHGHGHMWSRERKALEAR